MSLPPCPTACRWETFESHHTLEHGRPVQPFVRSLRTCSYPVPFDMFLSIRGVFYQRPPWGAVRRPVLCPSVSPPSEIMVAIAVGYTRLGGVATRLLRFDRTQAYHSCYTLRGGA
jgi:hypothetical protein